MGWALSWGRRVASYLRTTLTPLLWTLCLVLLKLTLLSPHGFVFLREIGLVCNTPEIVHCSCNSLIILRGPFFSSTIILESFQIALVSFGFVWLWNTFEPDNYFDSVKVKRIAKLFKRDVQDLGEPANLRLLWGRPACVTFNFDRIYSRLSPYFAFQ